MSILFSVPRRSIPWLVAGLCVVEAVALRRLAAAGEPSTSFWSFLACHGAAFACYALAMVLCLRWQAVSAPGVLIGATLLRATVVGTTPFLSDDVYRYLWEGRVTAAGLNPFVLAPADPGLAGLRAGFPHTVGHGEIPSVYPPLSQAWFLALDAAGGTVMTAQLGAMLADLLTIGLLWTILARRGVGPASLVAYAWNPLPVVELAQGAHVDVIAIMLLVAAVAAAERGWAWLTPLLAGASASAKLLGGALWARTARDRPGWTAVGGALFAASWIPFLDPAALTGLGTYARSWEFNGSLYPLLDALLPWPGARWASGALWIAAVLWTARRGEAADVAQAAGRAFFLLSPTAHPWYLCWSLPWLTLRPSLAWTVLSGTVVLSYHVLSTADPVTGAWHEAWWIRVLEYGPFLALWLVELRSGRGRSAGAAGPG